jgi:hypothetical protein
MLAARGYAYSVNLDPDVVSTRPWDLGVLGRVDLLAGRRVGSTRRTLEWLQTMASEPCAAGAAAGRCNILYFTILYYYIIRLYDTTRQHKADAGVAAGDD